MALKAGIVGLPNVGKSTLFNAITKKNILAANYPFATIDPNVGVVTVPDSRLEYLENLYVPERTIPTTFEFTDIAGLVKGAASGEGLGNKFLSHIRETDAIVEVVRCFDDADIIHVEGKTDPIRDIEIINVELILADLEIAENRVSKIQKKAETTKDKDAVAEYEVLKKCVDALTNNIPLRHLEFSEDELLQLKNFNFITLKPIIYVANIKEDELTGKNIDIRTCEFSHIRSVSMYQEYSDNIENGLIVNKETHDKITRKEINDEDELYDLCIDNGWNLQWYEKYKKHLNKWTSY